MAAVIEARDLSKHYGQVVAVDGLTLTIARGEVFGMLGPNGSGKTTSILMLLGLTEPTAGEVRVLGEDPQRRPLSVKRRVGYLPESVGFYDDLSARENLRYTARLNAIPTAATEPRIGDALARVGLTDAGDRAVGAFSRGMRQRLGLADVLLKQPEVAILDEPTLGLDPEAALEFLSMIRSLKAEGLTVLLSSHLLHQVQAICDRVGLFDRGRMVLQGRVDDLSRQVLGGAFRILAEAQGDGFDHALAQIPDVVRVRRQPPDTYVIEARSDCRAEVARRIVEAGGALRGMALEALGLDEVYTRYFQERRHGS